MAPSGGQICNKCKRCHVVAKFNPSHGANFWVRCASGNVSTSFWHCLHLSSKFWTEKQLFRYAVFDGWSFILHGMNLFFRMKWSVFTRLFNVILPPPTLRARRGQLIASWGISVLYWAAIQCMCNMCIQCNRFNCMELILLYIILSLTSCSQPASSSEGPCLPRIWPPTTFSIFAQMFALRSSGGRGAAKCNTSTTGKAIVPGNPQVDTCFNWPKEWQLAKLTQIATDYHFFHMSEKIKHWPGFIA